MTSSPKTTKPTSPAIVKNLEFTQTANSVVSVSARNISKSFEIGAKANDNIREDVLNGIKNIGKLLTGKRERNVFWALKDINFEIKRGETLGIIGRNGAGKSTLLKILSRITFPTTGEVKYKGRLASLLEVGTGFHRELTGRENIYLNGSILGMKRKEIDAQFDEIVDFAGTEKFLDTPIKHYSSGMTVRLAFAVAAHLRTDILIVDEVLAVGDAQFQSKCLGKMQDVASDGRTVLFVSHNMSAVQNLCKRVAYLQNGQLEAIGETGEMIEFYLQKNESHQSGEVQLESENFPTMRLLSRNEVISSIPMGRGFDFELDYTFPSPPQGLRVGLILENNLGERIMNFSNVLEAPTALENIPAVGTIRCSIPKMNLIANHYFVTVKVGGAHGDLASFDRVTVLEVSPADVFGTGRNPIKVHGYCYQDATWEATAR